MTWSEITEALEHLNQPVYWYIASALVVLALILVYLVRRQPRHVVAYTTENGRVMVSRSAIVELVQTSCNQISDVSKPQVKIKVKGKVTHFDVGVKLQTGGRLRSVEETLQKHLRHALTENLGIEDLGRINIVATGFKSGRIDSSDLQQASLPDPTLEAYQDAEDAETERT